MTSTITCNFARLTRAIRAPLVAGALLLLAMLAAGCARPVAPDATNACRFEFAPPADFPAADLATAATPKLIAHATDRGLITPGERLVYLAYAVYEPERLPVAFQSNAGWHGTSVVEELTQVAASRPIICNLDPCAQQELRRLVSGALSCAPS